MPADYDRGESKRLLETNLGFLVFEPIAGERLVPYLAARCRQSRSHRFGNPRRRSTVRPCLHHPHVCDQLAMITAGVYSFSWIDHVHGRARAKSPSGRALSRAEQVRQHCTCPMNPVLRAHPGSSDS